MGIFIISIPIIWYFAELKAAIITLRQMSNTSFPMYQTYRVQVPSSTRFPLQTTIPVTINQPLVRVSAVNTIGSSSLYLPSSRLVLRHQVPINTSRTHYSNATSSSPPQTMRLEAEVGAETSHYTSNPESERTTIRTALQSSTSKVTPYFQVRKREQHQYPEYTTDTQPISNLLNFKALSMVPESDLVEYQVVEAEPSDEQPVIRRILTDKLQFNDTGFKTAQKLDSSLAWRRFSDAFPNPQLFLSINPSNIVQGSFADCYFLVAIAALAERPQRIRDLFPWRKVNPNRAFCCNIIFRGRWKTIYTDDQFPLPRDDTQMKKQRGCARSRNGQMWVSVLEKAWAKLLGSYAIAENGFPDEAIHDLTGAHIRLVRPQDANFNPEEYWKELVEATQKGYAIVVQSPIGDDTQISESGIVFGHAYTVLGAYEVIVLGEMVRLVKCRNPWAHHEWGLDWSDIDPRWKAVTEQDKDRIGYIRNSKDGQFFLSYEDMCDWMIKITIAQIYDGSSYVFSTQPSKDGQKRFFKVSILKKGWYSFQLSHTSKKLLKERKNGFAYKTATINIGQLLPNNGIKYHPGVQSNDKTIFRKLLLSPGEYIVSTEQWYYESDPYKQITLAIYGEYYCKIGIAPQGLTANFHQKLFLSKARGIAKPIAMNVTYVQEVLQEEGYLYSAVFNNTSDLISFRGRTYKNLNPDVKQIDPFTQTLAPGEEFVIYTRIPNCKVWTSHLCGIELLE